MNCEHFRERIALLPVLRSEFDLDSAAREHARNCLRCARTLADRMALDVLLDAAEDLDPPARLRRAVLDRVRHDPAVQPVTTRLLVRRTALTLSAAALVLLALTLFHLDRRAGGEASPKDGGAEREMVANIDLLLDWEILVEHADDLDLVRAEPLIRAVTENDDGEQG